MQTASINFFRCFVIGEGSLTLECIKILWEEHHDVLGVISSDKEVLQWAQQSKLPFYKPDDGFYAILSQQPFDYLFSIVNPTILSNRILALPTQCAINYHDAPLPRYAGVHATTWALLNREKEHGVTWHVMAEKVDAGNILQQSLFPVEQNETAFTLNIKCYETAIKSFEKLITELAEGKVNPIQQHLAERSFFSKNKRPQQGAIIQWRQPAAEIDALCRALSFFPYPNPLCLPKLALGSELYIIDEWEVDRPSPAPTTKPGLIKRLSSEYLTVATTTNAITIKGVSLMDGTPKPLLEVIKRHQLYLGQVLPPIEAEAANRIETISRQFAKHESFWRTRLKTAQPVEFPYLNPFTPATSEESIKTFSLSLPAGAKTFFDQHGYSPQHALLTLLFIYVGRLADKERIDLAFAPAKLAHKVDTLKGFFATELPLGIDYHPEMSFEEAYQYLHRERQLIEQSQGYMRDLVARTPSLQSRRDVLRLISSTIAIREVDDFAAAPSSATVGLTLLVAPQSVAEQASGMENHSNKKWGMLAYNPARIEPGAVARMAGHLQKLLAGLIANPEQSVAHLPLLANDERHLLLHGFNNTQIDFPSDKTIIGLFEEQVEKMPNSIAVVFEDKELTYQQLNEKANQAGHYLREHYYIQPDDIIALQLERSEWMIIAILGVLKAGAAYVPIDPDFPKARIKYVLQDSQAKALLTDERTYVAARDLEKTLPVLSVERLTNGKKENPERINSSRDLAYIMYTSGSTGQPKGVCVEHINVIRLVKSSNYLPFDSKQVFLQLADYSFDASTFEIWGALLHGGKLVTIPSKQTDLKSISRAIQENGVTIIWLTAGLFHLMVDTEIKNLTSLQYLLAGGDVLSTFHVNKAIASLPNCTIINGYGPTENTTFSTTCNLSQFKRIEGSCPIGRPISNTEVFILNNSQELLPIGAAGELCVSGAGLARGYLNNSKLTAEKFIPHPFKEGKRLYKTGDLGRWLPDGNIEFLGRLDNQLKIRGYRIEAGEIEQALLQHPAIQSAVVISKEVAQTKELVAYLACGGKAMPDTESLRHYLSEQLPDYMVPAYFVELASFPLTINGKVNRKVLPNPGVNSLARGTTYVAPRNLVEATLVEVFENVLYKAGIGIYDNFFDLGIHSLRAIRAVALIQQQLPVKITLSEIFTHPTIAELGQAIAKKDSVLFQPIEPITEQPFYALSHAQRRLWVLHHLEENMTAYNIPAVIGIEGQLNVKALEQAFEALINRHEILRTCFVTGRDGLPQQAIGPISSFHLPYRNWQDKAPSVLDEYIQAHAHHAFDLSEGNLLKVELLQRSTTSHILLFNMHHIISDGWSMAILFRELSIGYEAAEKSLNSPLPALKIQYKDYVAWQNRLLSESERMAELRQYWQARLADFQTLELPADFPRPLKKSYQGDELKHTFSPEVLKQLETLSRTSRASLFMTLATLVKILLYRYTRQEDIVIGTPTAGRNHLDLHNQIGFYVNTLVLRNTLVAEESFTETLAKVKQTTLAAFERDLYPFDLLVEDLNLERNQSHNPIFDVMLVLQNNEQSELKFGDTELNLMPGSFNVSKFDLTFSFATSPEGLHLNIEYSLDLFLTSRIQRMIGHLVTLIDSVVTKPSQPIEQLNILPQSERQMLLCGFNPDSYWDKSDFPSDKTIIDLFEAQVEKVPGNIAFVFGGRELTYQQLNERANRVAHYLRDSYDIQPDDIIALQLERSEWMIIAILSILKAGAAYLPVGIGFPRARIEYVLKDSKAKLLLTDKPTYQTAKDFEELVSVEQIEEIIDPNTNNLARLTHGRNLAYIIYTSGSTGQPKGVMIEHQAIVNRLNWMQNVYPIAEGDCILQKTPYTFDVSVWELLWWALQGAKVGMLAPGAEKEPDKIIEAIERYKVTTMHFVPSMLSAFLQHITVHPLSGQTHSLRQVFTSGEALNASQVLDFRRLVGSQVSLHNLYGPTEASIDVSYFDCSQIENPAQSVPIGKPIENIQLYILDKQLEVLPIGVAGELHIGGIGLARGYLNNESLTQEKFIPHPFTLGERLYKTGDLARWLPNGDIEFLGRMDHQLKIRGYRIEAGEVEQALLQHPAIQNCVVVGKEIGGNQELVAYVVIQSEEWPDMVSRLRSFLSQYLPAYMVPAYFVELSAMPLTANGKINRKALPSPEGLNIASKAAYIAPRNKTEQALAKIWEELFKRENIGINDNFLDLGGHSLLAIRLSAMIQQKLSANVSLSVIFDQPTVAGLAQAIQPVDRKKAALFSSIPKIE